MKKRVEPILEAITYQILSVIITILVLFSFFPDSPVEKNLFAAGVLIIVKILLYINVRTIAKRVFKALRRKK